MRTFLAVAIAAAFVLAAWAHHPADGDTGRISMSPLDLMRVHHDLPADQYPAF